MVPILVVRAAESPRGVAVATVAHGHGDGGRVPLPMLSGVCVPLGAGGRRRAPGPQRRELQYISHPQRGCVQARRTHTST